MCTHFTIYKYPYDIYELFKFKLYKKFDILSIDPARDNLALGIYRFVKDSKITTRVLIRHEFAKKQYDYKNICEFLSGFNYKRVKLIIVEKQLSFNILASNIAKAILLYFGCRYDCIILEVSPKLKSKMFPELSGLKGDMLKKTTVYIILHQLKKDGDKKTYKIIQKNEKQDDLADTIAQWRAIRRWLKDSKNRRLLRMYIETVGLAIT